RNFPLLKILARGSQIKIAGKAEDVQAAKEKLELVLQYLERNGSISPSFLNQLLGNADDDSGAQLLDALKNNDVLVYGPTGKVIKAKTANQKLMVETADKNDIIFALGPAGTGKTYTAVALAVRALKNKTVKKIILTRPAVEAGESLGFLPGDLKEK